MEPTFDLAIIGAGEAGQAAAHLARKLGGSVAIIDRELFGGSCPFWACMPSKALLHAAAIHHLGGDFPWQRASDFRDWMIVREHTDWPDDSGHVKDLEAAGTVVMRGEGRIDGPGRVVVASTDGERTIIAKAILVSVGTNSTIPDDIEGLDQIRPWTNREATSTRELPRSLVILGAGPTGVEMAQVYARYGVPTVLISPHDRINPKDHPRSSATLDAALRHDGVDIRTGVRAIRVSPGAGRDGGHAVDLSDESTVEGHEILLAIGRTAPLDGLGLETLGVRLEHDQEAGHEEPGEIAAEPGLVDEVGELRGVRLGRLRGLVVALHQRPGSKAVEIRSAAGGGSGWIARGGDGRGGAAGEQTSEADQADDQEQPAGARDGAPTSSRRALRRGRRRAEIVRNGVHRSNLRGNRGRGDNNEPVRSPRVRRACAETG